MASNIQDYQTSFEKIEKYHTLRELVLETMLDVEVTKNENQAFPQKLALPFTVPASYSSLYQTLCQIIEMGNFEGKVSEEDVAVFSKEPPKEFVESKLGENLRLYHQYQKVDAESQKRISQDLKKYWRLYDPATGNYAINEFHWLSPPQAIGRCIQERATIKGNFQRDLGIDITALNDRLVTKYIFKERYSN
ncbi:MAG: hypothetical protein NDI94_04440 [Candidatus Woesearchaeota archaeon]|nr:hypothetical protein [Candidatus Woesearchaeota archaeon]